MLVRLVTTLSTCPPGENWCGFHPYPDAGAVGPFQAEGDAAQDLFPKRAGDRPVLCISVVLPFGIAQGRTVSKPALHRLYTGDTKHALGHGIDFCHTLV